MDRQPTERGDREGRRRDVLDAARVLFALDEPAPEVSTEEPEDE